MRDIRPSIKPGWYPRDPEELTQSLDTFYRRANIKCPTGKICGLIVPHAGHIYSGQVAAYAFNCIKKSHPDVVAIISPSHFIGGADIIVSSHDAYKTPLGEIEIDKELLNKIIAKLDKEFEISTKRVSGDPEHAIEVELPFLQHIYKKFRLIPIMIRNQNIEVSKALGLVLSETLNKEKSLLIASSDLSHYYNQSSANKMDRAIIKRIEAFEPESVLKAEEEGIGQACGIGAISTVLWACQYNGASKVDIMNYATSGDVSGDYDGVVGYVSALIT